MQLKHITKVVKRLSIITTILLCYCTRPQIDSTWSTKLTTTTKKKNSSSQQDTNRGLGGPGGSRGPLIRGLGDHFRELGDPLRGIGDPLRGLEDHFRGLGGPGGSRDLFKRELGDPLRGLGDHFRGIGDLGGQRRFSRLKPSSFITKSRLPGDTRPFMSNVGKGALPLHEQYNPAMREREFVSFVSSQRMAAAGDAGRTSASQNTSSGPQQDNNHPRIIYEDGLHLEGLQKEVSDFLEACGQDSAFQQLRTAVVTTEAQLKDDPSNAKLNAELQKRLEDHRSKFQSHSLFQKGIRLGYAASKLRIEAEDKAQFTALNPLDRESSASRYIAEAIKEEVLTPVRQALVRPSSPRSKATIEAVASGVSQSAWDTGKALLVDIPAMLKKFGINAAQSVATWEDKLGLQEGFASAKELLSALFQEVRHDWENPEEYRQRLATAHEHQRCLMLHERSFNAEAYHLNNAKEAGYVTSEALQFVFGPEIVKGASKAVSVLRGTKGAKGVISIAEGDILRIQNAANRINKPIHLVGSRAKGTARITSDFDYVIEGISNKQWTKIKNSLPGAPSRIDNLPRRIDLFKRPLDLTKPYITFYPK